MTTIARRSAFAFVLLLAGFSAAGAETPAQIKARGKMVIGIMVDVPPFALMDDHNQPAGYDYDVAKLLGERMGVPTELMVVTGPNRIPYLLTGKVDMLVAVLGIIPERTKLVDFSEPYEGFSQFIYGKKELPIKGIADLKGLTIGVPRANTTDITLTKVAPPGTNILRFDDDSSVMQALLSGQVDATTASTTSQPIYEKLAPGRFDRKFDLQTQVNGIALRKGQPELLAWVNAAIEDMKKDGTLEKINTKWVGGPMPPLTMPDFAKP